MLYNTDTWMHQALKGTTMSAVSFVSFCIENYAEYINRPSNEVYSLFKREGLLEMLRQDYSDLHGMGMEYMVQFCDNYLVNKAELCGGGVIMHATIRATLLPEIVRLISERYGCSEEDAMDRFYGSATGASFSDDETGLYGQSALYIFSLFVEEMEHSK